MESSILMIILLDPIAVMHAAELRLQQVQSSRWSTRSTILGILGALSDLAEFCSNSQGHAVRSKLGLLAEGVLEASDEALLLSRFFNPLFSGLDVSKFPQN